MRLYCLSDDPNLPCFILTVDGRSILLDFPLPIDHILDYLPVPSPGCLNRFTSLPKYTLLSHNKENHLPQQIDELRISHNQLYVYSPIEFYTLDSNQYDFSLIDIILISNYETFLALPYLFKKHQNLNAQIYLTEPTYRFGQQLMYELVTYVKQQSKMIQINNEWRYDPEIFDAIEDQQKDKKLKLFSYAQKLMPCYSIEDVDQCLSHVTIVHFNEQIDLYSSIRASAISSGYCLGSCNWQLDINVNHNQTSKLQNSSSQSNLSRFIYMSSSTTLETYSSKFSYDSFINCDYLLLSNLSRISSIDASSNATELTSKIEGIINDHGSVIIPCLSTGLIYDMFEFLTKYFEQINVLNIHMYFISPVSNANLSISNAMSEWVTEQRQTASFSGIPPFKHNELIKSKCLITIPSDRLDDTENLINFEQPSVIFTGHTSLRYGPIVQLIEKMKSSSSNGIIFVDNHYSYIDALKPYQPMNMKCFHLPIDTRLNFSQVNILLNDKIRPKNLILHEQYFNDITKNDKVKVFPYRKYDNIKLPKINRSFINGQLNIKNDIKPKMISSSSNLAVASVQGHLDMCDYVYDINEMNEKDIKENQLITYGRIDIDKFLVNLSKSGLFGLEIKRLNDFDQDFNDNEQTNRSVEINYNHGTAKILVRPKQTDIQCNDPLLMNKIRDALLMDNIGTL
jgi:integrator complex subunit 9